MSNITQQEIVVEIKPLPTVGDKYSHWTVIAGPISKPAGQTAWWCRCTCNKEKEVRQSSLISGVSRSCGCARKEDTPVTSNETKELLKHRRATQSPPRPKGSITSEETKAKLSEAATKRWAARKSQLLSKPCNHPNNKAY